MKQKTQVLCVAGVKTDMGQENSKYEEQKQQHKRELVRNEYQVVGKYNIPLIKKQQIDLDKIEFISYVNTKQDDEQNKHKTVHFFYSRLAF